MHGLIFETSIWLLAGSTRWLRARLELQGVNIQHAWQDHWPRQTNTRLAPALLTHKRRMQITSQTRSYVWSACLVQLASHCFLTITATCSFAFCIAITEPTNMPSMMASKHTQLHCQTVRQKPEHSTQRNMQQTTPTIIAQSFFPAAVFCNCFLNFSICARALESNRRITLRRLWVLACSWAFCVCLQQQPPAFDGQTPRASDAHKPDVLVNATADIFSIKKRSTYMHQHANQRSRTMFLYRKGRPAVNIQQQSSITVEQLPRTYQQPS